MKKSKRIAHCIHHTHWDPFWYFTAQDSLVVFAYNVKEMLRAFENKEIEDFFLDGQTVAIDEYLDYHPEDRDRITELVKSKKLVIGPFVSQLDTFISSGESIINNLRLGIRNAEKLGGSSKIAYLADPFGQTYDFPKIFNQFGIYDFVFTRGMGEIYNLKNEFYFQSNDGSQVLSHVLLSGYGYGHYAFIEGTLFTNQAEDYNRINVSSLIDRLVEKSSLKNEFVFPLGFDQNPITYGIKEKIVKYNQKFPDYEFKYTNWRDFMDRVRQQGENLKVHNSEILSAQYHRIHISGMNSARVDIKNLIDETERILTFETQPLMSMLDAIGIPYDASIIDKAWYTLVNCQTHASATHIDDTNRWIFSNTKIAHDLAFASKIYLMRLLSTSIGNQNTEKIPILVFNTLPYRSNQVIKMHIFTKEPSFALSCNDEKLEFSIISSEKKYAGVIRKDSSLMTEDKWFYKTTITTTIKGFKGISYKTIYVHQQSNSIDAARASEQSNFIENNRYRIEKTEKGINITDKILCKKFENVLYIEDGGDEGDSYDYSYPDVDKEWIIKHNFDFIDSCKCINTTDYSEMTMIGHFMIPADLNERLKKLNTKSLEYKVIIEIKNDQPVIRIHGNLNNNSKNHRVRLGIKTEIQNSFSYAGTQFGYIKRECNPAEMAYWKEKDFFEEPSSTKPLLNHVSAVGDIVVTAFTRSLKEYDFVGDQKEDICLTMLRSAGHVGLPDLNRRPGRPSGLANKIFETPDLQMIGEVGFDIGVAYYDSFDGNRITKDYTKFATDSLYYQNQSLDKTVFPISYFPINPLKFVFPDEFSFIELDDSDACFGTIKKSDNGLGYVLRIFNSENSPIQGGKIVYFDQSVTLKRVNLLEEFISPLEKDLGELASGELINLLLLKKETENLK